jgi:membrane protein implicated in regulation of membrane protease activity
MEEAVVIGTVFLLLAVLAVLLWAAGIVPLVALWKTLAGLVAILVVYVASAAIGSRLRRARRRRQPSPPVFSLMGIAGEPIAKGDLIRIDYTGRVVRISRDPTADELKETGKPQ